MKKGTTKKQSTSSRSQVAKTGQTMRIGNRSVPIHRATSSRALDAGAYIPLAGKAGRKGPRHVIRLEDVAPMALRAEFDVPGPMHFGDTLLDIFTPMYGSIWPRGDFPRFTFMGSKLRMTDYSAWALDRSGDFDYDPYLRFVVSTNGLASVYMRVTVGQTTDAGVTNSILTVFINGERFDLDLSSVSHRAFGLLSLVPVSNKLDVSFEVRGDATDDTRALVSVLSVELYESILAVPPSTHE